MRETKRTQVRAMPSARRAVPREGPIARRTPWRCAVTRQQQRPRARLTKMTLSAIAADAKLVGSTRVPAKSTRSGKRVLPSASRHWLTVAGSPGQTSPTQPSPAGLSCRNASASVVAAPRASAMKVALRITLGHTPGKPAGRRDVSGGGQGPLSERGARDTTTRFATLAEAPRHRSHRHARTLPAVKVTHHPRSSRWVTGGWSGSVSASLAGSSQPSAGVGRPALSGASSTGTSPPPPPEGDD